MTDKSDGKLGSREFFALVGYAIAIEFSDMTPTFLFKDGKTATWMIPLFSGAIIIIPFLILLSIMKKFRNKGLIDIIYTLTGKYWGFIISMVLFIIMFAALVLNSRNYVDIIQIMFFPRTPSVAIFLIFMGTSYFIANRGLENIGRTAWIFYPYLIGVLVLVVILASKEVRLGFIHPLWGSGVREVIKSSVQNITILADVFMLTLFYPYARSHKEFKTPVVLGLLSSIFQLSLFIFFYTVIYDYPTAEGVAFPFQQMIMLVSIGRFLTNIEAFFFLFWVVASLIRFALYLYLTAAIFGYTLGLKEFEPLLLPFSVITVMLGLIPKNYVESVLVYRRNFLLGRSWAVFIFLPLILWAAFKIRGEKIK